MTATLLPVPARPGATAAASWRLLGHLCSRPGPDFVDVTRRLAREVAETELVQLSEVAYEASEDDYLTLVGDGGLTSACVSTLVGAEDPARVRAAVQATYRELGFTPACGEPPDHLSALCGFVGYLWDEEAAAESREAFVTAETLAAARASFVAEHVEPAAKAFLAALGVVPESYLAEVARVLVLQLGAAERCAPEACPTGVDGEPDCSACPMRRSCGVG